MRREHSILKQRIARTPHQCSSYRSNMTNTTHRVGGIGGGKGGNLSPPPFLADLESKFVSSNERAVGGGVGAMVFPDFDRQVTPNSTMGADYTHHITTSPSPSLDFRTFNNCSNSLPPCAPLTQIFRPSTVSGLIRSLAPISRSKTRVWNDLGQHDANL